MKEGMKLGFRSQGLEAFMLATESCMVSSEWWM